MAYVEGPVVHDADSHIMEVPGWMRALDSAHTAFARNEDRLRAMSVEPSEYVRRQVRVTPYPHEDAGFYSPGLSPV